MTKKKIINAKRQYIMTLGCTLVAILLIVDFTFLSFYYIARSDAVAIGEGSVAEQSERLNNFLLKGLDVLEVTGITVDYMLDEGADSEEILEYLTRQTRDYAEKIDGNYTGIYGLFKGEYLDGVGWIPDEDYDPKTRPWYIAAVEANGAPVIVSPYVDAQTNSVMISVSQMLSDGESVISLDIVMDEMQRFAENINLNGKGYGFIIDEEGLVVAHSDEKEKGKNYLSDEACQGTEMQKIIEKVIDGRGETISVRINGEDSRVFSKMVQEDWYVVMIINVHDLFKKVETNLVINIGLSMLIFAVVAYFVRLSYQNRTVAMQYADELKEYQSTLEERVEEQTEEIKGQVVRMVQIQEDAVEGMATLIESRDGNTGEHVRNTKQYVSMILKYMHENKMHEGEITDSFIAKMESAAILHDVGKIKISDVVLNKPGRFTPEEYEIMKTHAAYGGEIVKDVLGKNADEELVQIASEIARYHHEKWDGRGYPDGLKGEEIPLSARIMAVADVFDALVSKRIYKDAMPVEKAMQILKQDAGTHFDPEIVEVFIKLKPTIEQHLKENSI
ncbi:MAG: HD domain-containing protein [Lachnospiraceae bacterium]|nr:HD domain-containing protein [Lachnospiraceae bacterium]